MKQKFEYPMAENIYSVSCKIPLETISLPEITFDISVAQEKKESEVKSDYSNYGSQYEQMEKKK